MLPHSCTLAGYDVWMANTRGNTFSRTHDKYGASDSAYWRFSMDDLALTDLPQVVAHVRQVTGAAKVRAACAEGHAQARGGPRQGHGWRACWGTGGRVRSLLSGVRAGHTRSGSLGPP